MVEKKKRGLNLRLGEELWRRLQAEHERTDAPKQKIIERALEAYLPPLQKPKRRSS